MSRSLGFAAFVAQRRKNYPLIIFSTDLTFGRVCSRSEKLMQASLFSRLIAAFTDLTDD